MSCAITYYLTYYLTMRRQKQRRLAFTEDEDALLFQYVAEIATRTSELKGNKIYQAFAEENPRHPAQSWRDRAIRRKVGDHPNIIRFLGVSEGKHCIALPDGFSCIMLILYTCVNRVFRLRSINRCA